MTTLPQITPPVVRDGVYDPGRYFPDVSSVTFRDGVTRDEIVAVIQYWIVERLVPFLNVQVELIDEGRQASIDELIAEVNAALASQATAVNAAVQQLLSGSISLNGPIVQALIEDTSSTVRQALNGRFIQKTPNGKNAITGWWHIEDFGAQASATVDSRAAIQAAIDAAAAEYDNTGQLVQQRVHVSDRTYYMGAVDFKQSGGAVDGACCLYLRNGVELCGPGTLRVKANAYGGGAYFAAIRTQYEGARHIGIRSLKIDGQRASQVASTNAGNILIEALEHVRIVDVFSVESNGNAIMVRGNAYGATGHDILIQNCRVAGANGIGIQCAQFTDVQILANQIVSTTDNGIDVYGEAGNHAATSTSTDFIIADNLVRNSSVGIFLESVAGGSVHGNEIHDTNEGFHINRINGEPKDLLITGNVVRRSAAGVGFTGDSGNTTIRNNLFTGFTDAGVKCGGAGNVGGLYVLDNTMLGNSDTVPLVLIRSGTQQLSRFIHLRTVTASKNRAYDTVNYASTGANNTWAPALAPGD